jgi:hypothetical protein
MQGPGGARASGEFHNNVGGLVKQAAPLGGEQPGNNEDVIQVGTFMSGYCKFLQSGPGCCRRRRPEEPLTSMQGWEVNPRRAGHTLSQTMPRGIPLHWGERHNGGIRTPRLDPADKGGLAVMWRQVKGYVQLHGVSSKHPVSEQATQ